MHTLFAREHNRIVDALPTASLPADAQFEIARRVVGAEIQCITYDEFLPALGVRLDPYHGYDPNVNSAITNEFATVGYRAHSMVHGEFEPTVPAGTYSASPARRPSARAGIDDRGQRRRDDHARRSARGHLRQPGPGRADRARPALESLGERAVQERRADRRLAAQRRSSRSRSPASRPEPSAATPAVNPDCFSDVADLGADDIERGRDHGMPTYNDLRRAYGLARPELVHRDHRRDDASPALPKIDARPDQRPEHPRLHLAERRRRQAGPRERRAAGHPVEGPPLDDRRAPQGDLRYGNVDKVDAFVGMVSEPHVPGTEFGPLQLAIWKSQFDGSA